jgi:HEAT repeat protein
MLSPDQVLPLLTSDNPDVRSEACVYFERLGDASPPPTALALWHASEKFGGEQEATGLRQLARYYRTLREVGPDAATTDLIFRKLADEISVEAARAGFTSLVLAVPAEFLRANQELGLGRLDDESQEAIDEQLRLYELPVEDLWKAFEAAVEESETAESWLDIQQIHGSRLVRALRMHPEFSIAKAMEILNHKNSSHWGWLWCCELLGQLRHAPAIDLLIEHLNDEDSDFIPAATMTALGRMSPEIVIPKLESAYVKIDDPYYHMNAAEAMGNTRHPLGEQALIRLLGLEKDAEAITSICTALCDLCTTEGLEDLRRVVIQNKYDSSIDDIKERLVTLCQMVGFDLPELVEWQKDIATARAGRPKLSEEDLEEIFSAFSTSSDDDDYEPERSPLNRVKAIEDFNEVTMPFRREGPKIGRNDPCPCGSGKKYKKCCGK